MISSEKNYLLHHRTEFVCIQVDASRSNSLIYCVYIRVCHGSITHSKRWVIGSSRKTLMFSHVRHIQDISTMLKMCGTRSREITQTTVKAVCLTRTTNPLVVDGVENWSQWRRLNSSGFLDTATSIATRKQASAPDKDPELQWLLPGYSRFDRVKGFCLGLHLGKKGSKM